MRSSTTHRLTCWRSVRLSIGRKHGGNLQQRVSQRIHNRDSERPNLVSCLERVRPELSRPCLGRDRRRGNNRLTPSAVPTTTRSTKIR